MKFHRKKDNNWTMVSFAHNRSEITTWMRYNLKTKSTKSQATSLRKKICLNYKLQIIRLAQGHWSCKLTHQNSYFYSQTFEKIYLAVNFTKGCFFCQFVDRKVMGLMAKYYLLACWRYKRGLYFFPYIR